MAGGPAERQAWITLASVRFVGEETFGQLLATFGSAAASLAAALDGRLDAWISERRAHDGRAPMPRPVRDDVVAAAADPGTVLDPIGELGLWSLTPLDSDYPARLRDLDPPPSVIHGLGDPQALHGPRAVAVVGTRRPTPAGRALAARICARLVECRVTVVSGMAIGIDGVAHASTVERDGTTVAVIGAGHHAPGPRAHARLAAEIVGSGGAMISEHHPTTRATKGTFPRRNRIIAALADAVVVVEAPIHSGARITAGRAFELGRPVFVAPGRVGDWSTAGSLALLRETPASPLVGLDELVEDLGYLGPADGGPSARLGHSREPALSLLGPAEREVARRLDDGPAGLDELVFSTGLSPGVVSSAVTLLLMRGWIQQVGAAYMPAGPLAE